ncbi:IS1634 family transposase [Methanosarcina mazei]|jgi:transposase|uniref:Transposase n=1 Tax=Methanosarcina mazei TaxID=2209 RepID=A0A0F8PC51_METMZ|nr:IS4 family transposase [Methanosarcina mazei]KKG02334.1 transposase [Methanosarcina mazei]KKG05236.1 transposase [Methanosarcina mazei]KKG51291.1 transposase [Methanosarcina mazei]KKG59636.1 transposase [Methanosarcina mazei]KKG61832.1 transposase [Methanosarcina mazei]
MNITKQRAFPTIPNKNICVPIGSILAIQLFYEKLNFCDIFSKHKSKGLDLNSLLIGLLSYKLTENFSIKEAGKWLNQEEILDILNLERFHERVLYRTLELLGRNREEILSDILDSLFSVYDFEETDINMDWTSIVLYGTKSNLGKYGYSRDHRPDKLQITVGISELADPINIPIGVTVNKGNVLDLEHFSDTYNQVKSRLKEGSLIVFDKGANTKDNINIIQDAEMEYLTAMKLNTSDDKIIEKFDLERAELIDSKKGIYGIKIVKPSSIKYFYFSEALQKRQLESKARAVMRKLKEAKEIQKAIINNKKLPKKFRVNNELIEIDYSFRTKLEELSDEEAIELLKASLINGREGFFCLKSNRDLTLEEALKIYRKKDSIEKIFHSLKNEIQIKPLRVWSDDSIYGAIILGFIAQLFISLMRYEFEDIKHRSTKFIKKSLKNLTLTINFKKNRIKNYIFANFDQINSLIVTKRNGIT